MLCSKRLAHFGPYLIYLRAYRWPQPDQQLPWVHLHRNQGVFQYATRQTAPASMGRSYPGAVPVSKQHWQTVCRQNAAGHTRSSAPAGISRSQRTGAGFNHCGAMHLFKPDWRTLQLLLQHISIGPYLPVIIANIVTQIKTFKRCKAVTARTRCYAGANVRGDRKSVV